MPDVAGAPVATHSRRRIDKAALERGRFTRRDMGDSGGEDLRGKKSIDLISAAGWRHIILGIFVLIIIYRRVEIVKISSAILRNSYVLQSEIL